MGRYLLEVVNHYDGYVSGKAKGDEYHLASILPDILHNLEEGEGITIVPDLGE